MDSDRADLNLVIGYDLSTDGKDYTGIVLMALREDGSLEDLETPIPGHYGRGALLDLCLNAITRLRPKTCATRVGQGNPQFISQKTVEAVLAGTRTRNDLFIG